MAWEQTARAWMSRTRARAVTDGEQHLEARLVGEGYEVLARRVPGRWTVQSDGAAVDVSLRAELIVSRGGRRYAAMKKPREVRPDADATRRELLEHRIAFGVDGVVWLDPGSDLVVVVELASVDAAVDEARSRAVSCWFPVFAFGVAAGALLVLFTK